MLLQGWYKGAEQLEVKPATSNKHLSVRNKRSILLTVYCPFREMNHPRLSPLCPCPLRCTHPTVIGTTP